MHHSVRNTWALVPVLAWMLAVPLPTQMAHTRPVTSASGVKKVLGFEDYARWRLIEGSRISSDGHWVAYGYRRHNSLDPKLELHILHVDSNKDETVPNALQATFSDDSKWIAYFVDLAYAEAKKLRESDKPVTRDVQLRNLDTGALSTWKDIQSFTFARGSGHLLLRRRQQDARAKHKGVDVIVRDLATGRDHFLGSVGEVAFNRQGELLAYTIDAGERDANGLFVLDLRSARVMPLDNEAMVYSRLAWNEAGTALAVLKGNDIEGKRERENVLIAFPDVHNALANLALAKPVTLDATIAGFPKDVVVSERRDLVWSADGKRVFFGTKEQAAAVPRQEKKPTTDEVPDVDVWNTRDERIQSLQMMRAEQDRNFTWRAAFDVSIARYIPLTDRTMREMELTLDGRWGIGRDARAYVSDYKRPSADLYRVNTATGERTLIVRQQITITSTGTHILGTSPDSRHFLYWRDNQFQIYDLDTGRTRPVTRPGAVSFVNMEFDFSGPRPSYGVVSWTKDGRGLVLQHRYDLWLGRIDGGAPVNLTGGLGAKDEIKFRHVNTVATEGMGPMERAQAVAIDPSAPMLLSAYGEWTKKAGFFERRDGRMNKLVFDDAAFGPLSKASKADRFLVTRETFTDYPDLYISGPSLADAKAITDTNPYLSEYLWGHQTLFEYTNKKGVRLQGLLALPDDYKAGEKRPMIVTFYEKTSQILHRFPTPTFLSAMISIPIQAVSEGYVAMIPDIHFNIGSSHSDMLECVEAATKKVIEMGYADPKRIGVHGHSYGGQGVAFIGTRSKMFAAIGMSAAATDLTSDFSHNWGWSYHVPSSGANAFDYYLYNQGRLGTSPWENPELYRFESARTHAPKASAPFLIMHGTLDGVVAFQEALGFYNALRYNGKNAVLLAYPGEGHSLRGLANRRDFTVRYFQFFDHYLRGKPAARWMTEGVPFLEKDTRRDAEKDR
ncbi:MAG TPA: prolyl oligopeptidase family serine peptidase [Gemmatimonadaceae bacterium]|nr:prolyl oligopeptidase family serine peptidase [Gemmatimonadaceae bacterium]